MIDQDIVRLEARIAQVEESLGGSRQLVRWAEDDLARASARERKLDADMDELVAEMATERGRLIEKIEQVNAELDDWVRLAGEAERAYRLWKARAESLSEDLEKRVDDHVKASLATIGVAWEPGERGARQIQSTAVAIIEERMRIAEALGVPCDEGYADAVMDRVDVARRAELAEAALVEERGRTWQAWERCAKAEDSYAWMIDRAARGLSGTPSLDAYRELGERAARAESARDLAFVRLTLAEHADRPWPVVRIVERLADAADHLMRDHDCDAHGYESVCAARDAAREWLKERAEVQSAMLDEGGWNAWYVAAAGFVARMRGRER
jgi:hypothetical protein